MVITGNFNAGEKNQAAVRLIGPFVDTFRVVRPNELTHQVPRAGVSLEHRLASN